MLWRMSEADYTPISMWTTYRRRILPTQGLFIIICAVLAYFYRVPLERLAVYFVFFQLLAIFSAWQGTRVHNRLMEIERKRRLLLHATEETRAKRR
jgi:uncharacterized membrane protein